VERTPGAGGNSATTLSRGRRRRPRESAKFQKFCNMVVTGRNLLQGIGVTEYWLSGRPPLAFGARGPIWDGFDGFFGGAAVLYGGSEWSGLKREYAWKKTQTDRASDSRR
jgi:hypothetical protein